jgi:hypothetical protein
VLKQFCQIRHRAKVVITINPPIRVLCEAFIETIGSSNNTPATIAAEYREIGAIKKEVSTAKAHNIDTLSGFLTLIAHPKAIKANVSHKKGLDTSPAKMEVPSPIENI